MFKLAILSVLLLLCVVLADDIWSYCGDPKNDLLKIENVIIKPIPIVKGKQIYAAFQGLLKQNVTAATAEIKVKYGFVTVYHETLNVCDMLKDANTTYKCPIAAGNIFITSPPDFVVPSVAPSGTYEGTVQAWDQAKKQITCIKFKVKLASNSVAEPLLENINLKLNDERVISTLNNIKGKTAWVAGKNAIFDGMTVSEVKSRFLGSRSLKLNFRRKKAAAKRANFPDSFDWRDVSKCVHPVRDQGHCGSCWAFGATEALSDRFCVASKGKIDVILSPQYLVDCDSGNMGCSGGYLDAAWEFMATGVPDDKCYPYTSAAGQEGECKNKCADGSPMKKYRSTNVRNVVGEDDMMAEIQSKGPIEVAFSVYRDFMSYKEGVYSHKSGSFLGGHAIKAVGWGKTTDGTPYWICANSWTENWGNKGYFWILKGNDECGIESEGITADPILN